METKLPLVSIIALCYNHERFLTETLDSITGQDYPHLELVILDDFSRDGSVAAINKWIGEKNINCRFIVNEENLGICRSINKALKHCRGSYFQVIACDDIMLPHKISEQVGQLEQQPNAAFAFSDAILMNENSEWQSFGPRFIQTNIQLFKPIPANLYRLLLEQKNFIPAPTALIRTKCVEEIGGFDESLTFEDYDMWLRLSRKYDACFSETPNCLYRVHGNNMTRSLQRESLHIASRFDLLYKHIGVSAETDRTLEDKLYQLLKQLFYNNFPGTAAYAVKYYTHFSKDPNLKQSIRLGAGKQFMYRIFTRLNLFK